MTCLQDSADLCAVGPQEHWPQQVARQVAACEGDITFVRGTQLEYTWGMILGGSKGGRRSRTSRILMENESCHIREYNLLPAVKSPTVQGLSDGHCDWKYCAV
jgi:hypothetical protein